MMGKSGEWWVVGSGGGRFDYVGCSGEYAHEQIKSGMYDLSNYIEYKMNEGRCSILTKV
jgi:hypothetical protein